MLNGNILVKEVKEEENRTASGLLLAPTVGKSYKIVEVFGAGPEETAKVGDRLYVPVHSGTEVEVDSEQFLIIHTKEIILIL